jgi:uncharacterized membrane protein
VDHWTVRSPAAPDQEDKPITASMSITTTLTAWRASPTYRGLRFGRETGAPGARWSVLWVMQRNASLAPRQMLWCLAALVLLTLGIAAAFWLRGATLVMPFAGLELVVLGLALALHARHAGDGERIALRDDGLTVEHACGRQLRRVEFQPAWVRVEPRHGDRSLIELSGQGRQIAVGRFVRPELRLQLADELRWALRRWQQHAAQAGNGSTTSETTEHSPR